MRLKCYDTDDVRPVEQFAYWNDAICKTFTALDCQPATRGTPRTLGYRARLDILDLGRIQISNVRCDESNVEHSEFEVAKSGEELNLLHLQTKGESLNLQNGNEAFLRTGDFTICDSTDPYAVRFSDPIEMLVVRIPKEILEERFLISRNVYGHHFKKSENNGFSKLVANSISCIWENRESIASESHAASVSASVLSLLSGHLSSFGTFGYDQDSDPSTRLLESMRVLISNMLSDPRLSPELVAAAVGISPRYLRKIFAQHDMTCSRYIANQRLSAAHEYLADSRYHKSKIIDIAYRCGFTSAAHFSHVFKDRYGLCPSAFRRSRMSSD